MERRHSPVAKPLHEDVSQAAPTRASDPRELAERLRNVARAYPLGAFAAVLVAGYVLGRMLRR